MIIFNEYALKITKGGEGPVIETYKPGRRPNIH